jgi:hypothetical protein
MQSEAAILLTTNARIQMDAIQMGWKRYLTGEIEGSHYP